MLEPQIKGGGGLEPYVMGFAGRVSHVAGDAVQERRVRKEPGEAVLRTRVIDTNTWHGHENKCQVSLRDWKAVEAQRKVVEADGRSLTRRWRMGTTADTATA